MSTLAARLAEARQRSALALKDADAFLVSARAAVSLAAQTRRQEVIMALEAPIAAPSIPTADVDLALEEDEEEEASLAA